MPWERGYLCLALSPSELLEGTKWSIFDQRNQSVQGSLGGCPGALSCSSFPWVTGRKAQVSTSQTYEEVNSDNSWGPARREAQDANPSQAPPPCLQTLPAPLLAPKLQSFLTSPAPTIAPEEGISYSRRHLGRLPEGGGNASGCQEDFK